MAASLFWDNRRTTATERPGRLPTVAELFREIVTPLLDRSDELPPCSAREALERQETFINQTLAYWALALLARLFRHRELTYHGGFMNLGSGRVTPLEVGKSLLCRLANTIHISASRVRMTPRGGIYRALTRAI